MNWKKKNPAFSAIEDVVFANTGMTIEEMDAEKEYRINNLGKVTTTIRSAISQNQEICVVTDYDADGICSAAIMKLTLTAAGANPYIRIPKRISEGYGLNTLIVDELPNNCLLICVDNGISAYEAIKKAKNRDMTVIVLDHHMLPDDGILPPADIIIDPSAIGEADFTHYCGAGLAYKLSESLLGKVHPVVAKCLSFATIATVADVMPLIGENRLIVKKGLKMMLTPRGRTKGLEALIKLTELDIAINEKNIGFKIAPCINAPGRLYDDGAIKSYNLMICENYNEAVKLAEDIISDNLLRKNKKESYVSLLEELIDNNNLYNDVPLILYQPDIDEGLVGLLAGHFAEEMKRPCFVFTNAETEGILKGSARSYGDIHLKNVLDENADLIEKFGGHKGAAGLSIKSDNLKLFHSALKNSMKGYTLVEDCCFDLEIDEKDVSFIISKLKKFEPFGEGNPEITFKINNFQITPTQKGYVSLMSDGKHGKVVNKNKVAAIAFGMGKRLTTEVNSKPKTLNLYGKLSENISRYGRVEQIEVSDFEVQERPVPVTSFASRLRKAATE